MSFLPKVLAFFIGLVLFFTPAQAHAENNFTTDYNVVYTIRDDGIAEAVLTATLTNTNSDFYATSYQMQLNLDDISNIRVTDAKGEIKPDVVKTDNGYVIGIVFNNKAVGLNAKQQFVLTYDTPTLARKYGNAWEISIPGISNPNDFRSFIVELRTPSSFGEPAYIKPKQPSNSLIFSKEAIGQAGISIAFGDKQLYDFALTYHVQNPNLYPTTTQIALPSDTSYQKVAITDIEPRPDNVIIDDDGNWLAEYKMASVERMDVVVRGHAETHLTPESVMLTPEERFAYTQADEYWEAADTKIHEIADGLKTPEAIYAYVMETLEYDFDRVTGEHNRYGAVGALQNPKAALCYEYADLFIALARAAGIPAREVTGFAHSENPKVRPLAAEADILHVWPEYYDENQKAWIMVDPTWGDTTNGVDYFEVMDFSHFAFATHGFDSAYPVSAGGYKYADKPMSKDVSVTFRSAPFTGRSLFEVASLLPDLTVAGFPIGSSVRIQNTGSVFLPPRLLTVSSDTFLPSEQALQSEGVPPFGYTDVSLSFQPTSFLTNTEGDYTILVAGVKEQRTLRSAPFFNTPLGGGIAIGILAIIILIIAIAGWRLRVFR